MDIRYESKKDRWLVILIWITAFVMLAAAFVFLHAPVPTPIRLLVPVIFIIVSFLMLWTLYGTYYVLTERELVIRSGPFRWLIPLDSITEVSSTRNPQSSPACSLDRLLLLYGPRGSSIMISPEDRDGFVRNLALPPERVILNNPK